MAGIIWCIKPPMGYDILRTDVCERLWQILPVKVKMAFEWKAAGRKNDEILKCLRPMGVKHYKQKLSMIFSNPFYCGIIANTMLDGQLVEGIHEKNISKDLFLQANEVRKAAKGKFGVT